MAIENRDRLLKKLQRIQGTPRQAVSRALEQGAQQIVEIQKRLAPRGKTGNLQKSIKYSKGGLSEAAADAGNGVTVGGVDIKGDPDLTYIITAGDREAFYATWVEFGTAPHISGGLFPGYEISAQASPFFYPGYRAVRKAVKARITRAMRKAIKDSVR